MAAQTCATCFLSKTVEDGYTLDKQGKPYPNCNLCFHSSNVLFWSDKRFKQCFTCKVDRAIRKFDMYDGVPHRNCRNCYETMVSKKKAAERAAKAAANDAASLPLSDPTRDLYKQQFLQLKEQQAALKKRMLEDPSGVLAELMAAQEQHNSAAPAEASKRKLEGDS